MASHQSRSNSQPAIWARLIQAQKEPIPPETAAYLLSLRFSEADDDRMQVLMDKSDEGTLTPEDETEFDNYLHIANLLTIMHSQVRMPLRNAGFQPPRDEHTS